MKKKIYLFCATVISGMLLTACGAKDATTTENAAYAVKEEAYATDDVYMRDMAGGAMAAAEAPEAAAASETQTAAVGPEVQSPRKLIRNANMDVETEEFDTLIVTVEERVKSLGGYMENYQTSKNSKYYGGGISNRWASMTIRIPAVSYEQFVNEVSAVSNVLNRNESVQDVTLQYVDLESHKKVLLTEQERLLELLEKAENIEDIIAIESRLSEVRYQIESMESQLRTYDNMVDYSTIYLSVNEVTQLTPVQEQSVGEKIGTGFVKSCKTLGTGLLNLFIGIIVASPFLILVAVIIVVTLVIIKLCVKIKNRKKKKNESA